MQASVTIVFRSAIVSGSISIAAARPANACRTTATFSALAGTVNWTLRSPIPSFHTAPRCSQHRPRSQDTHEGAGPNPGCSDVCNHVGAGPVASAALPAPAEQAREPARPDVGPERADAPIGG